jgi:hypothetical protein
MRQTISPGLFLGGAVLLCTAWLAVRQPVVLEIQSRNGPRPTRVEPPSIELDTAVLERYAGGYEGRGDLAVTLTLKDGKLVLESNASIPDELRATSETEFFLKGMGFDIAFDVDDDGTVRGFTADTDYGAIRLKRVR